MERVARKRRKRDNRRTNYESKRRRVQRRHEASSSGIVVELAKESERTGGGTAAQRWYRRRGVGDVEGEACWGRADTGRGMRESEIAREGGRERDLESVRRGGGAAGRAAVAQHLPLVNWRTLAQFAPIR